MIAPISRRFTPIFVVCALLSLLVASVFGRVVTHPFVGFDDNAYVTDNTNVRDGLSAHGTTWAFKSLHASNWHPLTWLSHQLDAQLFGLRAGGHHLTNLLLHAVNTVLLFLALRAMTGAFWPPALVAALFAVHPLHVESVAWVAERKDVLSSLFWMLTLLAWTRYARRPGAGRYLAAASVFALGLLAKPMLVTLPFVLLLLDIWPLGRIGPGRLSLGRAGSLVFEKIPFLALAAASSVVTIIAQRSGHSVLPLSVMPLAGRAGHAFISWLRYVAMTLWPANLAPFYPLEWRPLPAWQTAGAALLLAAVTTGALLLWRRRPYLSVGWLWFVGTLVPVIGLVQVGMQSHADRYTYVPLVGLFLAVAWAGADLARTSCRARLSLLAMAGATVGICAVAAWFQVGRWSSDQRLFGRTVAGAQSNWRAELNLGIGLFRQGRYDEAIGHYEAARRAMPMDAAIHYNLGLAYGVKQRYLEALESFEIAAGMQPWDADTQGNLGTALMHLGRFDEARERFQTALRLRPGDAVAAANLATVLSRLGRHAEAQEALATAKRFERERRTR